MKSYMNSIPINVTDVSNPSSFILFIQPYLLTNDYVFGN